MAGSPAAVPKYRKYPDPVGSVSISWLPMAGWISGLSRPQVGSKEASNSARGCVANWPAQRLYSWFGFRPVGVRKNYYAETGEDALVMWVDDVYRPDYKRTLESIIAEVPPGVRPY